MKTCCVSLFFVFLPALSSVSIAYTNVDDVEAKNMIDTDAFLLVIDVREDYQYCGLSGYPGHIPGAFNYPWNSGYLEDNYEELPIDPNILVVCQSGGRSAAASGFLEGLGYDHIYNKTGGMSIWPYAKVGCVDTDNDGSNDDLDNCPDTYNPSQTDSDFDGAGNACDLKCPNLDGQNPVNFSDFAILAIDFQRIQSALPGDLDSSGDVGISDVLIFAMHWLADCYE